MSPVTSKLATDVDRSADDSLLFRSHMLSLRELVTSELKKVVDATEVAYVDYALHGNTGDLLILSGAMEFFRSANITIKTFDNIYSAKFDELAKLPLDVPIVCHGGGNFGDLYPAHQNFREKLVARFPDRKIIVFPQSLHFSSEQALESSSKTFRNHPNFHLCVRDRESVEMAQKFTQNVKLVPDCAHMLWGKLPANKAGEGRFKFMRVDKESATSDKGNSVDWETMSPSAFYGRQALLQKITKRLSRRPTRIASKFAFWIWSIEVSQAIAEAIRVFSPYEVIETDRLHGMLFSLLIGKKVHFRDNSVKKLSRYSDAWLSQISRDQLQAL